MLAQSGNDTYALYLYADGLIQWTTADDVFGGNNGFGGNAAKVGICFRHTNLSYKLPGSGTCSIIHIASRSNVNIPGLLVFLLEAGNKQNFGIYFWNIFVVRVL